MMLLLYLQLFPKAVLYNSVYSPLQHPIDDVHLRPHTHVLLQLDPQGTH